MAFLKFHIDQFVSTYDYFRSLTRLRDLISTPSEMCCNDTIQFSIDMHCMCKYGRAKEYLPVCIFMFIHLIVILCMLNNIESHNINNNLWNRYDVGSAPIVFAHHRTVSRAYLCHAIVSRMDILRAMHKQMYNYKWPDYGDSHQRHQKWYVTMLSKLECELYLIWKYERKDEYSSVHILMFIYQLNRIKYSR